MTIRYATIWNDQRTRRAPLEEAAVGLSREEFQMEDAASTKKSRAAKPNGRKVCSGERLAVLLDTHRWSQRKKGKK